MTNSTYENACRFARAAVEDMLGAVTSHTSSARLRLTGEKTPYQFVWIMLDRVSAPAGGINKDPAGEEYIWAHTNDADFMVGYPPSLSISAPLSRASELQEQIVAFVEQEIANYGKVEALMQSEAVDRSQHRPNYIGDSESGYEAIHVMANHDTL